MAQRRRHQNGREFDVSFGFKAVHALISPATASDAIVYGSSSHEVPPVPLRCKTVNDSMGGLTLRYGGPGAQIRVGDVVGMRQGNNVWSIGLVRWFRIPAAGEVFFGVQLLAPQADAVQLRRLEQGQRKGIRDNLVIHDHERGRIEGAPPAELGEDGLGGVEHRVRAEEALAGTGKRGEAAHQGLAARDLRGVAARQGLAVRSRRRRHAARNRVPAVLLFPARRTVADRPAGHALHLLRKLARRTDARP
jgi:hypothetical protein